MAISKTRMSPLEAASFLGCGYDHLMLMVRQKKIPHYRLGRRAFFIKETLELWIEEKEKESVKEKTLY